jgi:hypothetical protein
LIRYYEQELETKLKAPPFSDAVEIDSTIHLEVDSPYNEIIGLTPHDLTAIFPHEAVPIRTVVTLVAQAYKYAIFAVVRPQLNITFFLAPTVGASIKYLFISPDEEDNIENPVLETLAAAGMAQVPTTV